MRERDKLARPQLQMIVVLKANQVDTHLSIDFEEAATGCGTGAQATEEEMKPVCCVYCPQATSSLLVEKAAAKPSFGKTLMQIGFDASDWPECYDLSRRGRGRF